MLQPVQLLTSILFNKILITRKFVERSNKLFEGKLDSYKGVTVDSNKEQCSITEFAAKLEESLTFWKHNGNRTIWFNVHLDQSNWVPILAKKGFKYHHALNEYVTMYLWLPKTENSNVPQYAHTMLGVGAVVINDKNQLLTIREKSSLVGKGLWKIPGGFVEPDENIVDAAIREVREETSIESEFHSLLTIRQTHRRMFQCSDIYTVVSLKPLSKDIKKSDREIIECKWMDIEEYLNHERIHELNKFQVKKYMEYRKRNIKLSSLEGFHQLLKKQYTLFAITSDDSDDCKLLKECTKNKN